MREENQDPNQEGANQNTHTQCSSERKQATGNDRIGMEGQHRKINRITKNRDTQAWTQAQTQAQEQSARAEREMIRNCPMTV